MPPLYLVQQNTKIRIKNRRIQVEKDDPDGSHEVLTTIPLGQVSQIVLFGNIGLTTPAIDAFLTNGIDVVFLSIRGEYRGRLLGSISPHVPLRKAQYMALNDPARCLALAKMFVQAKLEHQKALLLRNSREARSPAVQESVAALNRNLTQIENKIALTSLRGLEGASTAAYFSGLRDFFAPEWRFNARNRRPPADPVNVLLSFGYTLMVHNVTAAIETVGLDPFVGFLHEYVYNRPALALDIMEEFRPVIDGLVLWVCSSAQITPADFTEGTPDRPVILGDDGKRRFIRAYEARMDQPFTHAIRQVRMPLRQCLIEQTRQLAQILMDEQTTYRSMGFR